MLLIYLCIVKPVISICCVQLRFDNYSINEYDDNDDDDDDDCLRLKS